MAKSHNPNTTRPAFSRKMVPNIFLNLHNSVASAKRWQGNRDACVDRLSKLIGMAIPESLTAAFTNLFEHFHGVEDTTAEQVARIHDAYIRISDWARIPLAAVGRGTFSISPMIAAPLSWTTTELEVTGADVRFPMGRNSDGFSTFLPAMDKHGQQRHGVSLEIGSLGAENFGLIWAFKGQVFKDASGKSRPDVVKMLVYPSHECDGRLFNDWCRDGNGDAVYKAVMGVWQAVHDHPEDVLAGRDAAKRGYLAAMKAMVGEVIGGNAAAKAAVVASMGGSGQVEETASPNDAAATVATALGNLVPKGAMQESTALIVVTTPVDANAIHVVGGDDAVEARIEAAAEAPTVEVHEAVVDPEVEAGKAACEAKALDDGVVSACANDPEAAALMERLRLNEIARADAAAKLKKAEEETHAHNARRAVAAASAAVREVEATPVAAKKSTKKKSTKKKVAATAAE